MKQICSSMVAFSLLFLSGSLGAQDPGKDEIGSLRVSLLFGTASDPAGLGVETTPVKDEEQQRLRRSKRIPSFKHYVQLGSVEKPIFRGYENWAKPMPDSEALMVSFQPQGRIGLEKLRMDLELWQKRKLVLRTDPILVKNKRVYILGPEWQDGNLIITVELVDLNSQ